MLSLLKTCLFVELKWISLLIFSEKKGKTHLNYTIQLESKIPLTTSLIKVVLGTGIKRGLKRYARTL